MAIITICEKIEMSNGNAILINFAKLLQRNIKLETDIPGEGEDIEHKNKRTNGLCVF